MTPLPTPEELAARHLFDPVPGSVHIRDLINQVKDGIYAKDKLSDYAIGIILWAKYIGMITAWEGTLFQVPWVKDMKLRVKVPHVGRPLLGPDGNFLTLMGRALQGASEGDLDKSNLTPDALLSHPGYANWVKRNLFAGRTPEATRYKRVRDADNVKDCDVYVNSIPYAPGPLSTPPAPVLGSSPEPVTKKKVAPRASLKADKPAFKGTRAPQADHEGETRGEDAG